MIKQAFQELYEVEVLKINTHITPRGEKVASIQLKDSDAAEDIAVRMGVF